MNVQSLVGAGESGAVGQIDHEVPRLSRSMIQFPREQAALSQIRRNDREIFSSCVTMQEQIPDDTSRGEAQ